MTAPTDIAELKRELQAHSRRLDQELALKKRLRRKLKALRSDADPSDVPLKRAATGFLGMLALGLVWLLLAPSPSFDDEAEQSAKTRNDQRWSEIVVAREARERLRLKSELDEVKRFGVEDQAGAFPCLSNQLEPKASRDALLAARWANISIAACTADEIDLAKRAFLKLRAEVRRGKDPLADRLVFTASNRCSGLGVRLE